jgi:hypothetical protein
MLCACREAEALDTLKGLLENDLVKPKRKGVLASSVGIAQLQTAIGTPMAARSSSFAIPA